MLFLSTLQRKFYDDNGYIVLDILNDEEVQELLREYDTVFYSHNMDNLEATWGGDWKKKDINVEVKSIHSMEMHSAAFTKLLFNQKLLDACQDIMSTQNILLHHTKSHLKPPGTGAPFPMHQDYHYFPFKENSMIAIFISLDASNPENGGLCVYPGSHLLGPQEDMSSVSSHHYLNQKKFPIENASALSLKQGQIVIFSYLLIHGSYENKSERIRRMHLIQLRSAEDEPLDAAHPSHCQGLVLRGRNIMKGANIQERHLKERI